MYTKMVQSGTLIEIYTYEKEPIPHDIRKSKKRVHSYRRRRGGNISRARATFFRMVRANISPSKVPAFLTLTMREITTLGEGWRAFTLFSQRLRNKTPKVSIIAVPEFQKRGAVHFHALVWGLGEEEPCLQSKQFYRDKTGKKKRKHICNEERQCEQHTRRIAELWGHGYVDLFATDGSPKLATYLAKYMQKTMRDERLAGKKCYSASRNIMRSVSLKSAEAHYLIEREIAGDTITAEGQILEGVDNSLTPLEEKTYNTKWLGRCHYKQYNLEKTYDSKECSVDSPQSPA